MNRSLLAISMIQFVHGLSFGSAESPSPAGLPRGITTTGSGLATGPAVRATLQIPIVSAERFHGPPQMPRVESVAGTRTRATVAAIGDAIRTNRSATDLALVVPFPTPGYGGPGALARFDVEIANPDAEALTVLLNDVARAASDIDLMLGTVGARFHPADCGTLEREARRLAFEDAQRQAQIQAEILGRWPEGVVASADIPGQYMPMHGMFGSMMMPFDSCATPLPTAYTAGAHSGITLAPFDPALQPVRAEVWRRVQVTFALG